LTPPPMTTISKRSPKRRGPCPKVARNCRRKSWDRAKRLLRMARVILTRSSGEGERQEPTKINYAVREARSPMLTVWRGTKEWRSCDPDEMTQGPASFALLVPLALSCAHVKVRSTPHAPQPLPPQRAVYVSQTFLPSCDVLEAKGSQYYFKRGCCKDRGRPAP
jgi:hypothetical protein